MITMMNNGVNIRWINTAGFEVILPSGAHLLVDPWLDHSDIYPLSVDQIERADYILLSHIHHDHAQDVSALLQRFPKARLFVGDLSTEPLCRWQHISLTNIYRIRSGEEYIFDDVKINVFAGRHTENAKGVYWPEKFSEDHGSIDGISGWYGSMELHNFLLTTNDGTRILIWAGQSTPDQKYRFQGLKPDIAVMHLSPKQDPVSFAELVESIGAQVVIPHHHDLTEPLFTAHPELIDVMLPGSAKEAYLVDGKFDTKAFVGTYNKVLKERVPYANMMELVHHKWYHFGLAYETES